MDKKSITNILYLSIQDVKRRYSGQRLGRLWPIINPLFSLSLILCVLYFGLKLQFQGPYPLILWVIVGMIPWLYFSDTILQGTNVFREYDFLIKKYPFPMEKLPLIKMISGSFVYSILLILVFLPLYLFFGFHPDIASFFTSFVLLLYAAFSLFVFTFGCIQITSILTIFYPDANPIVSLLVQTFFWFTPIFWAPHMIPHSFLFFLHLNPIFYIIDLHRIAFFHSPSPPIYAHGSFWTLNFILFLIGQYLFNNNKKWVADYL